MQEIDMSHLVQCPKIVFHKFKKIVQALILPFVQFFGDFQGHKEFGKECRLVCRYLQTAKCVHDSH